MRSTAPVWGLPPFFRQRPRLRGDTDEAKSELAKAVKLDPEFSSITKILSLANFHDVGAPRYFATRKETFEAGLRRAGMPED